MSDEGTVPDANGLLSLADRQLAALPPDLLQQPGLVALDLRGHAFRQLPEELAQLPDLELLLIDETPELRLPPTIGRLARQGPERYTRAAFELRAASRRRWGSIVWAGLLALGLAQQHPAGAAGLLALASLAVVSTPDRTGLPQAQTRPLRILPSSLGIVGAALCLAPFPVALWLALFIQLLALSALLLPSGGRLARLGPALALAGATALLPVAGPPIRAGFFGVSGVGAPGAILNPRDGAGRPIRLRADGVCTAWRYSGPAPVDCPPELEAPPFSDCVGLLHRAQGAAGCLCVAQPGDPGVPLPCPGDEVAGAPDPAPLDESPE